MILHWYVFLTICIQASCALADCGDMSTCEYSSIKGKDRLYVNIDLPAGSLGMMAKNVNGKGGSKEYVRK